MKFKTVLILAALVLVLGWLVIERRRSEQEQIGTPPEVAMFEDLRVDRVRGLRIDHLIRGLQIRIERDTTGRWFLTEPVPYPAETTLVRTILDQIAACRGPVDREPDLANLALDPPFLVVELLEDAPDGSERRRRVEIGTTDIDESRIYVRVPDHARAPDGTAAVLRVSRALRNTLDRNPNDYRDPRATSLLGRSVVSLTRRGTVQRATGEVVALEFDARRAASAWRRSNPPAVRLDSTSMGLLTRGAAELRVSRFVDDSGDGAELFGLNDPCFTLLLEGKDGTKEKLLFVRDRSPGAPAAEEATWYAMREDFPHVWEVTWNELELLVAPADMFIDVRLMQMPRKDVLRIAIDGKDRSLVFDLEDEGWWVAESRPASAVVRYRADSGAVEDLLAIFEQAELGDCPPDLAPPPASGDVVSVTSRTGEVQGGRLGDPWRDPTTGRAGRVFRRHGDEMLQLADEKVTGLWDLSLNDVRSPVLVRVDEFLVDRVRITCGEVEHRYYRDQKEWHEATSRQVAPLDTQILLGDLMRLSAIAWVDDDLAPADPITVQLQGRFPGRQVTFTLDLDGTGGDVLTLDGNRTARLAPGLHGRLRILFP